MSFVQSVLIICYLKKLQLTSFFHGRIACLSAAAATLIFYGNVIRAYGFQGNRLGVVSHLGGVAWRLRLTFAVDHCAAD